MQGAAPGPHAPAWLRTDLFTCCNARSGYVGIINRTVRGHCALLVRPSPYPPPRPCRRRRPRDAVPTASTHGGRRTQHTCPGRIRGRTRRGASTCSGARARHLHHGPNSIVHRVGRASSCHHASPRALAERVLVSRVHGAAQARQGAAGSQAGPSHVRRWPLMFVCVSVVPHACRATAPSTSRASRVSDTGPIPTPSNRIRRRTCNMRVHCTA